MWDMASSSWKPSQRTVYTNNSGGMATQYVIQLWSDPNWMDFYRVSITYNSANKAEQEVAEVWAGTSWISSRRSTHTYDGNGYLTHNLDENWDFATSGWKQAAQVDYTNNSEGDPTLTLGQSWNASTNGWVNSFRTTMVYDGASGVALDAASNGSLSVYPNPSNGQFIVTLSGGQAYGATAQVFNAMGQIVHEARIAGATFGLDLAGRPAGVYVLRVSNAGNTIVAQRKLVVTGAK